MREPGGPFAFAEEREDAELIEGVRGGRIGAPGPRAAEVRRAWWKRKRWAAALLAWLAASYPLSYGPVLYCHARGWIVIDDRISGVYEPLYAACTWSPWVDDVVVWWERWWIDLGISHGEFE